MEYLEFELIDFFFLNDTRAFNSDSPIGPNWAHIEPRAKSGKARSGPNLHRAEILLV